MTSSKSKGFFEILKKDGTVRKNKPYSIHKKLAFGSDNNCDIVITEKDYHISQHAILYYNESNDNFMLDILQPLLINGLERGKDGEQNAILHDQDLFTLGSRTFRILIIDNNNSDNIEKNKLNLEEISPELLIENKKRKNEVEQDKEEENQENEKKREYKRKREEEEEEKEKEKEEEKEEEKGKEDEGDVGNKKKDAKSKIKKLHGYATPEALLIACEKQIEEKLKIEKVESDSGYFECVDNKNNIRIDYKVSEKSGKYSITSVTGNLHLKEKSKEVPVKERRNEKLEEKKGKEDEKRGEIGKKKKIMKEKNVENEIRKLHGYTTPESLLIACERQIEEKLKMEKGESDSGYFECVDNKNNIHINYRLSKKSGRFSIGSITHGQETVENKE